jgi:hypothetical protein
MSRYVCDEDDNYQIVVGWDNPLKSYFFQKICKKNGREVLGSRLGDPKHSINTIDELKNAMKKCSLDIPAISFINLLKLDKENALPRTSLQELFARLMDQ